MKSQRIYGIGSGNFYKENTDNCIVEVMENSIFHHRQCRNNRKGYGENKDLCEKHSRMKKSKL